MSLKHLARCASFGCSVLLSSACGESGDRSAESLSSKSQALADPVTYVVLYKLESVPSSAASDVSKAGGTLVASYPNIGVLIARSTRSDFGSKLSAHRLVDGVAPTTGAGVWSLPASTSAQASVAQPAVASSGEPFADAQWNMKQIRAPEARAVTTGRKSVIVGVFDSGIDDTVADLQGQVDRTRSVTCIGGAPDSDPANWSFDAIGHGTHIAGIIAAKENGKGVVGVAPGISLAAVKLTEDGYVYPEAFICGAYWAATHDFDLVNASLIVDPWYYNCPSDPVQRTLLTAQQRAVAFAGRKGVTVIAAAGNEQQDLANKTVDPFSPTDSDTVERPVSNACKLSPVELDSVIGVSGLSGAAKLAFYSNHGLGDIDLAAPGGDFHVPVPGNPSGQILSTIPSYSFYYQAAIDWNGRVAVGCSDGLDPNDPNSDPGSCAETYALLQGTSQAAPHVTGVAALAISRFGKMPTALLLTKLSLGASRIACPSGPYQPYPDDMPPLRCQGAAPYNGFYGAGRVDALSAVRLF